MLLWYSIFNWVCSIFEDELRSVVRLFSMSRIQVLNIFDRFVFGLFISELVKSLFLHQYFHRVYLVSIHLR